MADPRSPNFFVAGTQKAGTSYLCAALARHPAIFFSKVKEPMVFWRRQYSTDIYQEYLATHFDAARDERWVGEGSTLYFQSDLALQRIRQTLGRELLFLVCLRQPTEKAVSLYLHNFRRRRLTGREPITELGQTRLRVRPYSLYAEWCAKYAQAFGRDSIQYLTYDTLLESPERFVGDALAHLGLTADRKPMPRLVNPGLPLIWHDGVLTPDPHLTPLGESQVLPTFTVEQLETLQASFLDDIDRTADLIGQDLSHWRELPTFQRKEIDALKRSSWKPKSSLETPTPA